MRAYLTEAEISEQQIEAIVAKLEELETAYDNLSDEDKNKVSDYVDRIIAVLREKIPNGEYEELFRQRSAGYLKRRSSDGDMQEGTIRINNLEEAIEYFSSEDEVLARLRDPDVQELITWLQDPNWERYTQDELNSSMGYLSGVQDLINGKYEELGIEKNVDFTPWLNSDHFKSFETRNNNNISNANGDGDGDGDGDGNGGGMVDDNGDGDGDVNMDDAEELAGKLLAELDGAGTDVGSFLNLLTTIKSVNEFWAVNEAFASEEDDGNNIWQRFFDEEMTPRSRERFTDALMDLNIPHFITNGQVTNQGGAIRTDAQHVDAGYEIVERGRKYLFRGQGSKAFDSDGKETSVSSQSDAGENQKLQDVIEMARNWFSLDIPAGVKSQTEGMTDEQLIAEAKAGLEQYGPQIAEVLNMYENFPGAELVIRSLPINTINNQIEARVGVNPELTEDNVSDAIRFFKMAKSRFPDLYRLLLRGDTDGIFASLGVDESIQESVDGAMFETYEGDDFYHAYGTMWINEDKVDEAEYQGRTVKLGKPMRGDVKKFKVYVRNAKGNVVKVNFGDPDMRIRKSDPDARRSFRARHNCDNPGPRWKARYWSCRKW